MDLLEDQYWCFKISENPLVRMSWTYLDVEEEVMLHGDFVGQHQQPNTLYRCASLLSVVF